MFSRWAFSHVSVIQLALTVDANAQIADRLCCSLGQDLLDSLCSRATLGRREDGSQPRFRPAALFAMCVAYTGEC